jgi:hypothetical protein
MAHACNPSYSRGEDQEDMVQSQSQANSSRLYLEKTLHKKGLVKWFKM